MKDETHWKRFWNFHQASSIAHKLNMNKTKAFPKAFLNETVHEQDASTASEITARYQWHQWSVKDISSVACDTWRCLRFNFASFSVGWESGQLRPPVPTQRSPRVKICVMAVCRKSPPSVVFNHGWVSSGIAFREMTKPVTPKLLCLRIIHKWSNT